MKHELGTKYPLFLFETAPHIQPNKIKIRKGMYRCKCGGEFEAMVWNVKTGKSKYCKKCRAIMLSNRVSTHKLTKHKLYGLWCDIKKRCYNEKSEYYKNYGGRGILMSKEWQSSFITFYNDLIGIYNSGLEIDRIDNNKGYSKDNCRFVPRIENARNKRNNHFVLYDNKHITISNLAEILNIPYNTIWNRVKKGKYKIITNERPA